MSSTLASSVGRRFAGGGVAGGVWLGAVLEFDAVQLERDALVAGRGDVVAWFEAAGEADGLAFDEVRGGGVRLGFPDDQVDVDGRSVAVAAVTGDRDGGDRLAGVGGAQVDVAGEAAVAGEG